MLIINIYNPCDQQITVELHEYLRRNINRQDYGIIVVEGDFNAHHLLWNPRTYTRHDEEADEIVEMMTELELNLMLSAGSIIYPYVDIIIDLVWGNEEARNRIITCRMAEEKYYGSDAFIITLISSSVYLSIFARVIISRIERFERYYSNLLFNSFQSVLA